MSANESPAGRAEGPAPGLEPAMQAEGARGGGVQGAAVQSPAVQDAAVPGSFDAGWHDEREAAGRPFWAVPLVLSVWAIAVPLALSLWSDDDVEAAPQPRAASCATLARGLDAALRAADAGAAARLGHDLGRAGCPLPPDR